MWTVELSIVIPAYNVENHIALALNSLARQRARGFEVIVVDDGSSDRTGSVALERIRQEGLSDARVIRTENGGVSRARNVGLAEARGDYVLFVDGDDYVDPGLVRKTRALLDHAASLPDAILWKFVEVDERRVVSDFFRDKPALPALMNGPETLRRILIDRAIRLSMGSVAFRRQLLLDHGIRFAPGCVNGEDQEFIYKSLARSGLVACIDEALYFYVQRGTSITHTYNVKKFDFVHAFRRTAVDLRRADGEALRPVADMLENRYTVEDYFYNLKNCLNSAERPPIRRVLREIDLAYPGLNREMRALILRSVKNGGRLALSMYVFLLLPELYQAALGVKPAARRFGVGSPKGEL